MSYPQNPETIVIKNEFYPEGLREIDIWNYYKKHKNYLLKETIGKTIIVFLAAELNKFVVIRKNKGKGLLRLTPSDYDLIINGRTISFHTVMDKYSDYGIVDIDINDFEKAKKITSELYNLLMDAKFVDDLRIRYTGKESFHIKVNFKFDYPIDYIRNKLQVFITDNRNMINSDFTISHRRSKDIPNVDLLRNVYNAGHISLYSLSVDGLKCMEISDRSLSRFKKDMARIK